MARRRKRYVRDDEIKLAERTPCAGELVLARCHGHKSYFLAYWRPGLPGFVRPKDTAGYIEARYVMGWVPAAGNVHIPQEVKRNGQE